MSYTPRRWMLSGLLFLIALAACTPAATPAPTQDIFAIQTEVALTVQAGLTATSAARPTATVTNTPEPPTPTPTQSPTATLVSTSDMLPSVTPSSGGGLGSAPDRAVWMYNNPVDGTSFTPGEKFAVTWRIQNSGTTTWSEKYQMRYYLSDATLRMGQPDIPFPKEVKPNDQVDLTLNFTAPTTPGEYSTYWVLTNADGANFMLVTFSFKVSGTAPTATPEESSQQATATTASEATATQSEQASPEPTTGS